MIRMTPGFIREQIRRTRALTSRPFGVNLVPAVAHAGDGFESQLEACLEERISVLSLFWSDAAPFMERCHAAGVLVILQVGSVDEARDAAMAGVGIVNGRGLAAALLLGGSEPHWTTRTEGQTELMPNYAGQGVGLVHKIQPAAETVDDFIAEAERTIRGLTSLLA